MRSLTLVALLLASLPAAAQSEGGTISLGVGQQKVIQVSIVARVATGEPDVADVKQVGGGNELLVTGVGEGRTSLLVWRTNDTRLSYVVVVRKQDPKEVVSEVRALLGDREGIQIRVVGDRVYLDGETITTDDYDRVQQITQLYPSVKSFVRPSGNAKKLAAEALNKAYQKNGLKGVQATVVGSTLFLEGWVDSAEDMKKLDLVTHAVGEHAEFVAGGEVPLMMVTQNVVSIEFKKFGIVLNVTPTAYRSGNIGTEIYAEVSDIDRSISIRANGFDIHGFRLRDVKTNVTVKDGETIILSGLFNYNEDKEVSKVPLLGHIPIIGELFKSRNFIDKKTELAIYVTPRVVAPGSERVKELIQDARKLYKDAGDSVSFSIFD